MKKVANALFVIVIVAFLFLGFMRTIFFPDEIKESENRFANQLKPITLKGILEGTFQTSVSEALSDQVLLADTMKGAYNFATSKFEAVALKGHLSKDNGEYVSYKEGLIFGDHLVVEPSVFEEWKEWYDKKILNLQMQKSNNLNVNFYVYYIERDIDISFDTNTKVGTYSYLKLQLDAINIPSACFEINNYDDYSRYFFKTDHHWNCYGSYKGYQEVLFLMRIKEEPVPIIGEYLLDYKYSGSRANALGASDVYYEKFPAYRYDYPEMIITINGERVDDYGAQSTYLNEEPERINYGEFYGNDYGQIVIDTNNPEKENILLIGESFDNAILKLVASHFNKTHSIDLRHYENTFGKPFAFSEYVKENSIDKVLLIGNGEFFAYSMFFLED